jgi:hypothetical protein
MSDFKKVGEIHHKEHGKAGDLYRHSKTGKYHAEGAAGDGPSADGHDTREGALEHYKKASVAFNQREADMSASQAKSHADGLHIRSDMHKTEVASIDALEKGEGQERHHSSFWHGKIGKSNYTEVYKKGGKYSHKTFNDDGSGPIHSGEGFDSPFHAKDHAKKGPEKKMEKAEKSDVDKLLESGTFSPKEEASKESAEQVKHLEQKGYLKKSMHKAEKDAIDQFMKSEPRVQHHKGHRIERTGGYHEPRSGVRVETPETAQYHVMHDDEKGTTHLHSTKFTSAGEAKKYIDGLKKAEAMTLHKAEKKDFGVRSFDHTKKEKGTGKHWTVAHKAPKADSGYHTHTHHFDGKHEAMKYAQKWEKDIGQHNNDRPEIYGPDHDEK